MKSYTLDELNSAVGYTKPNPSTVAKPREYSLDELNQAVGINQTPKLIAAYESQKLPLLGEAEQEAWKTAMPGERAISVYKAYGVPLADKTAVRRAMKEATEYYLNPPPSDTQPEMRAMTPSEAFHADYVQPVKTFVHSLHDRPAFEYVPFLRQLLIPMRDVMDAKTEAARTQRLEMNTYGETPEEYRRMAEDIAIPYLREKNEAADEAERLSAPTAAVIGGGAGDLLPYMVEYGTTRGAANRLLGSAGDKLANIAESQTGKKVVKNLATTGVQTAINPQTLRETAQNIREGDSPAKAALKGFGQVYISNLSETMGGPVEETLGKLAGQNRLLGKAMEFYRQKYPKGKLADLMTEGGWNGFVGELSEEQAENLMQAAAGTQDFADKNASKIENINASVMSGKDLAATAATLAIPSLLGAGARLGGKATRKILQKVAGESQTAHGANLEDSGKVQTSPELLPGTNETAKLAEPSPFDTPEWEEKVNTALENAKKWAAENPEPVEAETAAKTTETPITTAPEAKPADPAVEVMKVVKDALDKAITEKTMPVTQEKKADQSSPAMVAQNATVEDESAEPAIPATEGATKLIADAGRAGVKLSRDDVKNAITGETAAVEDIETRTARKRDERIALDQAAERVRQIETRKRYDLAKKELTKKISPKKRAQLEGVLESDTEYQEALTTLRNEQRKATANALKEDRENKIRQAEAGKIDKSDMAVAPLHTLPPVVKSRIQEHARFLQGKVKANSSTWRALQRVIDDSGRDNTAAAIQQKERIIGHMKGERGMENIAGRWTHQEADPLIDLYTAKEGPKLAEESIASIDRGQPDATAKRLIDEIAYRPDTERTMSGIRPENPEAEIAPEQVARDWLEQVAGKRIPKKTAEVSIPKRPKDLLGREIVEPIGREQKELGFQASQSREIPIETESGKAWVSPEGKLRPEINEKAQAAIDKEVAGKGQMTLENATSIDPQTKRVLQAKKDLTNWLQGGTLHTGLPLDVLKNLAVIGADVIRKGFKSYQGWKKGLKDSIGNGYQKIESHLHDIWRESQKEYVRSHGELRKWRKSVYKELSEIRKLPVEPFRKVEFTAENMEKEFPVAAKVSTPIGSVELGKHQFEKIINKQRESYFGLIRPTLERPTVILQQKDGAKKFYKIFKKDGKLYFANIVIQKADLNISVSSHERNVSQFLRDIKEAIDTDRVLFRPPVQLPPSAYGRLDPDLGAAGVDGSINNISSVSEKSKSGVNKELTGWQATVQEAKKHVQAFLRGEVMHVGIPVDLIHDFTILGAELIRRGFTSLPRWSKAMIDRFGNRFKASDLKQLHRSSIVYFRDYLSKEKIRRWNKKQEGENQPVLFDIEPEDTGNYVTRQRKMAAQLLSDTVDDLKPLSGWRASLWDLHRNFKEVFNKHYGKVRKLILAPFDRAKGEFIRDQESWLKQLDANIVTKYGIKPGSKESADLQRYGEGKMTAAALEEKYGKAKAGKILQADTWFRNSYNQLLDEINAVRKQIYPNNPDKIIIPHQDYYRHFQELAEGLTGLKNIFDTPASISSKMALHSEYTKPYAKWLPFAQHRTGDSTKYDAVGGFLDYLKYWAYAKHIDPHIPVFRALARELVAATEDTPNEGKMNSFIKYLDNLAGDLAGKSNPFDRPIQDMLGRRTFRLINWASNRIKANMVLDNLSASISQIGNVPAGIARAGSVNSVKGFGRSVTGIILGNKPMEESNFLKERYFNGYDKFDHGILKYPKQFAKWALTVMDEVGTKYTWNSFYEQGKAKGVSDPVAYADGMTRSIVAGRGIGEVPLAQKSKVVQLLMPFQLEVANFWHVCRDMINERAFGQLIALAITDWLFNRAMEKIKGSPVLYDPIQATWDAAKEYMGEKNKAKGAAKAIGREVGEVFQNMPLGQLAAKFYPEFGWSDAGKLPRREFFGKANASRYGADIPGTLGSLTASKSAGEVLSKIALPFGGAQVKKTYEGLSTYLKGSERDKKGNVKWQVDRNPKSLLQSILFGKYTTPEAKKYLETRK